MRQVFSNIGWENKEKRRFYQSALQYYQKALRIAEQLQDEKQKTAIVKQIESIKTLIKNKQKTKNI